MSCCMRDAAALEALGIPTVIVVNDVFEPIAHATAALLNMPPSYVAEHVVWLPHPTSNLTKAQAAALIDARIEAIRAALAGTATAGVTIEHAAGITPLERARAIVDGLARSLRGPTGPSSSSNRLTTASCGDAFFSASSRAQTDRASCPLRSLPR